MNNIDQTRLARLRPEKLDDITVKEQILLIQKACGNVNPEKIALVFHECDYNIQQTINRIRAGHFEDEGWQTAKSTNKKKNHAQIDHKINGNNLSDSEHSPSQRTSPTSLLRDGQRQNDHFQYSSSTRSNIGRRAADLNRNHFIPSSQHNTYRHKPIRKTISSQPVFIETTSIVQQSNEERLRTKSPSTDEYEFADGIPQSLSFDNSQMKASLPILSKHRILSTIPQEPVSMHPSVQFSTVPIDIQFGDVQWNDSVPIAVSPIRDKIESTVVEHQQTEKQANIITDNNDHHVEQQQDFSIQDVRESNYSPHQTTNEINNPTIETTNLISSLSIAHDTSNGLTVVPPEISSHLSDHLTDTKSPIPNQYSSQSHISAPIPPVSTPHVSETNTTSTQYLVNNLQPNNNDFTSSAFTPFSTLVSYPEYPQTPPSNWNPQTSNYKTNSKPTIIPTNTYPQTATYQIPAQQQQIFFGTYPYSPLSPAVVPVFASLDQWSTATFPTSYDSYSYTTANYIPAYTNQQPYPIPMTKYDQQQVYDKEYVAHYGQSRSLNNDIAYHQQAQPIKDAHITTSKLSPNAATFCQTGPLTASPTTVYINPIGFSMPNYYSTIPTAIHQDRTLSSIDNRDNRNGASYSSTNNRNNYYHAQQQQQQQQRTHNNY